MRSLAPTLSQRDSQKAKTIRSLLRATSSVKGRARAELRGRRRALTAREQRVHARRLACHLGKSWRFRLATRVAFYWPADGEIDPRPLLRLGRRKQWHIPVLRGFPRRTLTFIRWRPGERLAPNRHGIPEPTRRGQRIRSPRALDILLMPVVGFDAEGHRLGMGSGFYDRTLAYLRPGRPWRRPHLVGLAHSCQQLERIVPNPWDIPLDAIVTEKGPLGRL